MDAGPEQDHRPHTINVPYGTVEWQWKCSTARNVRSLLFEVLDIQYVELVRLGRYRRTVSEIGANA